MKHIRNFLNEGILHCVVTMCDEKPSIAVPKCPNMLISTSIFSLPLVTFGFFISEDTSVLANQAPKVERTN
ncbi:MAG: hypothetical protein KBF13_10835 [Prevotella sp.]|nr:hypothetical protein [Prevotella sp.]